MVFDALRNWSTLRQSKKNLKVENTSLPNLEVINNTILNHPNRNSFTAFLVIDFGADPGHGEYHNPYPLSPDNLRTFFQEYPTSNLFHQRAMEMVNAVGSHSNLGLPFKLTFRERLEELGQILYGKTWESGVVVPRHKRRLNAFKSSKKYKKNNRISGAIPDGFVDVGRSGDLSIVSKNLKVVRGVREVLIVDRAEDIGIKEMLAKAKEIKIKTNNANEALFLIAKLVHDLHSTDLDMDTWNEKMTPLEGKDIFVGDYNGESGYPGVCRQEALMLHTVLADLGYNSTLVRGFGRNNRDNAEPHVWCEVKLEKKLVVVDISMQGRKYHADNFADFEAVGSFPQVQHDIRKVDPANRTDYYDMNGQWIYSTDYLY